MRSSDLQTAVSLPGMPPKRADVIVARTIILWAAMALWRLEQLTIRDRATHYETILKHLTEKH